MRMVEWSLQALQYGALGPSERRMFVSRLLEGITAMSSVRCTESKKACQQQTALHLQDPGLTSLLYWHGSHDHEQPRCSLIAVCA